MQETLEQVQGKWVCTQEDHWQGKSDIQEERQPQKEASSDPVPPSSSQANEQ